MTNGRPLQLGKVSDAEAAGISVIHQESTAFPDLNAVDNIFVGREIRRPRGWFLDRAAMRGRARSLLDRLDCDIDVERPLAELSVAHRQIVAMARALSHDCRLLIMDEPTASLSSRETDMLLRLCERLRQEGVSILYVSHRLREIFELADRVTVLRDGCQVTTRDISELDQEQLIQLMVGRAVTSEPPSSDSKRGPARLKVTKLCGAAFSDVSFTVHEGEVLGLAGLVGAGRSEVARAIFGIDPYDRGQVEMSGKRIPPHHTGKALQAGLALVPEDRQHEGLVLPMAVRENVSLSVLRELTSAGLIRQRAESELASDLISRLDIRVDRQQAAAATLSGGNQQKVVIAKWLACNPKLLILDEPTRGVDVGSKAQVHELIRRLASEGMATLVISSEIEELRVLCDRILVMCDGRVQGELPGSASPESILALALPQSSKTNSSESR